MVESLPPNELTPDLTSEYSSASDSGSGPSSDSGFTSYTQNSSSMTQSGNRQALFEIREFKATALTNAEPVNLLFYEQDRILLRGPSGSGKSLFLRALAGLRPSVGSAKFVANGEILYLAQNPVFIPGTVEENLKLPLGFKSHKHRKYPGEKVELWLKEFGFDRELLTRESKHLSGGEKQVIHLIRGLILEPNLLLLDEPTASLDQTRVQAVEEFIKQWVKESPRRAIILVTHERSANPKLLTKPEFVRL